MGMFSWFDRQVAPGYERGSRDDSELGSRAAKAIARENSGVFGGLFKTDTVVSRGEDAQRRAGNNGRRNAGSGPRSRPTRGATVRGNPDRSSSPRPWYLR